MKKYIEIVADTNDGDYITSRHEITDEELELIKPVIEAIKNFEPYIGTDPTWKRKHFHNYSIGERWRMDLGEKSPEDLYGHLEGFVNFDEMVPSGEDGIHTIKSVTLLIVQDEIKLL